MEPSKRHKRKGLYGTLLFHTLLLLCFIFLGLSYTTPPPAEEGISINFGYDNFGAGQLQPQEIVEEFKETAPSAEKVSNTEVVEIPSQTMEDAPSHKTEEKKAENTKEKVEDIEESTPKVNSRALYPGKKENTSVNQGVTDEEGDQGREDGDPNAKAYSGGGIGTNGIAFSLGGRVVSELKKPIYKSQVQGTVVVTIRVNRQGKVINATPGAKGSNTTNSYLHARAKEAALQTIFDPNPSAPEIQIGTIVYNFRLQ